MNRSKVYVEISGSCQRCGSSVIVCKALGCIEGREGLKVQPIEKYELSQYDANIVDLVTDKPLFKHDCDKCEWLGTIAFDALLQDGSTERMKADLYFCGGRASSVLGGSVIGRISDDPPDYVSYPMNVLSDHYDRLSKTPATHTPAVLEAFRRVRKRK